MKLEIIILMLIQAVAGLATDKAAALGAKLGDTLNDKIEGSDTEIDDQIKGPLKAFIDAFRKELNPETVDEEGPQASDLDGDTPTE